MTAYRVAVEGRERPLAARVEAALTFRQRLHGLMFRGGLPAGGGLFIPDCRSVHTFFMRFAIDLVYISSDGRVVRIVEAKRPWRLSWCRGARSVLELEAGAACAAGLQPGDMLLFEPARD